MKIMIIDDETELLEAYKTALKSEHEVHVFSNSIEAVRKYDASYDLVIVDHRMPFKMGEGVVFDIKYVNPDQKIAVISAVPDEVNFPENFKVRIFQKPVSLNLLKRIVEMTPR